MKQAECRSQNQHACLKHKHSSTQISCLVIRSFIAPKYFTLRLEMHDIQTRSQHNAVIRLRTARSGIRIPARTNLFYPKRLGHLWQTTRAIKRLPGSLPGGKAAAA